MTAVPSDVNNCTRAGECACNCCDKRRPRHCGSHYSHCHVDCTY
jgi:hypothetical protein